MTDAEREQLRIARSAMMQARARAKARGLFNAEIEREEDDDDSTFWEDVASIGRALREHKARH